LVPWVGGKSLAGPFLHQCFEADDELLEVVGAQLGVLNLGVVMTLVLERFNHRFKRFVVFTSPLLDAKDNVTASLVCP